MHEWLSVAQRSYCLPHEPGALCGSGKLVNLGTLMTYGGGLQQVTSQGLGQDWQGAYTLTDKWNTKDYTARNA